MTHQCCTSDCAQGRACPERVGRMVQDFETPQGRAALRAERAAQDARLDRWLRTWGRWLLIAAFTAFLILLASHAAPIAAAHYAAPHVGNPY